MAKRTRLIEPAEKVRLAEISADDSDGLEREEGEALTASLLTELAELQELLFTSGTHSMLVLLQGVDTSGKDGVVRCLAQGTGLHGMRVASFKVPTPEELSHDFLWRVHQQVPSKGEITVFNRSHYEDVLVVRVHELVPEEVWRERYEYIRDFEKMLVGNNTILLKFMLHISFEEQRQRLLQREEDDLKAWKLNVNDWKERDNWEVYWDAYQDAIEETSTREAPWHIVPSDKKWFRNLCIVERIVEALRPHKQAWLAELGLIGEKRRAELKEYRDSRGI
jgi:PPK2 family polyphosphate:nucleotide phosphotransferase